MKNQTKIFTKSIATWFTVIEIRRSYIPFVGEKYYASFEYGKSEDNLIKCDIARFNLDKLIAEISTMLDCEIDERHYIIK